MPRGGAAIVRNSTRHTNRSFDTEADIRKATRESSERPGPSKKRSQSVCTTRSRISLESTISAPPFRSKSKAAQRRHLTQSRTLDIDSHYDSPHTGKSPSKSPSKTLSTQKALEQFKMSRQSKPFAQLTSTQVNLIRQSWNILYSNRDRHGKNVMKSLEHRRPETTQLFCKAAVVTWLTPGRLPQAASIDGGDEGDEGAAGSSLQPSPTSPQPTGHDPKSLPAGHTYNDHIRLVIVLLEFVVDNIRECSKVVSYLRLAGGKHAALRESGLKPEYWETFGETTIEIIGAADGVQQSKETVRAWRMVVAGITHELRLGFESEMRKLREVATKEKAEKERRGSGQANSLNLTGAGSQQGSRRGSNCSQHGAQGQ